MFVCNEYKITDKVNQTSLIGVTDDDLTTIEVEIVRVLNRKTGETKCIAYQNRDGLIVAEGPELEKYIPSRGNGIGWIKPNYRYWGDNRDYILECDDLEGYTGRHIACIWHWYEPSANNFSIIDECSYYNRPLAFQGDVYEFFKRDLCMMAIMEETLYCYTAQRCLRFVHDNPRASIDNKCEFINGLLDKYYRACDDGHIQIDKAYRPDIFERINLYLKFDAERKERNKAKKTAQKRANKIARREAREATKNKP